VFDEVQTGMGRTGDLFAYQHTGVTPDIMALAKALGAGFPMGAFLTTEAAGKGMTPGTHGSTFGGNLLAMAAGNATLDVMLAPGFFERLRQMSLLFKQRLAEIKDRHPTIIAEVRGEGMLVGVRTVVPNGELVDALRAEKLLAVAAGDNVVRLLPPLIVDDADLAEGIARLDRAATALEHAAARKRAGEAAG
jgi:acetylornithine/N-succinyldiaminopimelate aminotransferase